MTKEMLELEVQSYILKVVREQKTGARKLMRVPAC